ncbi:MAG TPA: 50S ribosomal protein L3 [Gammaproteobacteria bacterium]|nr:50S ribosomal protein L3 [Gammaproteobacteria bacterium]
MTVGLVGRKCGMTRVFTEDGVSIPVTVIEVLPNRVTQIKTVDSDGYNAIQVTTGTRKRSRVSKPMAGHYAKAGIEPGRGLWEFRVNNNEADAITVGAELKVDLFSIGQLVDVTGTTKGKGYAGTIKRHHFAGQDATHGNSLSHRVPGSIGQRQSPGKVFKGKKMSGHLGDKQRTIQLQKIVRLDLERSLILIRGAVPGAPGSDVIIRPAVKAQQSGETK